MFKRIFDLALVLLSSPLWIPLLLLLALLVRVKLGHPVLFRQKRPGINAVVFELIKFRTMLNAYDETGLPLSDAARLTPFGQKLRALSLDELPELLNVLKGDMSLVGPRPLLIEYLRRYSPPQFRRHEVKPGITGWAQINGRNNISWNEKFMLDVWYVDHHNHWLDVKILCLTIVRVFQRKDISAIGHATMPMFEGCPENDDIQRR